MINVDVVHPEPHGHLVPESKLERYWAQNPGLRSLRRRRVTKFDPHAGITYAPMEYISQSITLRADLPSDDWILSTFTEFVRTENIERKSLPPPQCAEPLQVEQIEITDSFLDRLLSNSGNEISAILKVLDDLPESKDASAAGMARTIYELLCHPLVGSQKNRDNVSVDRFVEAVVPSISGQERLLIVMLGFPFKDQNRFRVPYAADQPDLGEISFMMRLYRLTQVLYQIHPFGVDVLLLTDGELYHNIFGVSLDKVQSYGEKLKTFRKRLNLHGTISFISLNELIGRASKDSLPQGNAWNAHAYIRDRLGALISTQADAQRPFEILTASMKWNSDSRAHLSDLSVSDAWSVLTSARTSVAPELHPIWDSFQERATQSALEYAAVNLMLRWLDLIHLFFPDAIRGTIHPKKNQFALVHANAAFPWNGIPWSAEWPRTIDDFEIKPYFSLATQAKIRRVSIRTFGSPCFYTKASLGRNVSAAKEVFPLGHWTYEDLTGRPFELGDALALAELGSGDSLFSWERLAMGANYYHRLLNFRIEHYQKHGFGVQGIWRDEVLIGQCGLQVLNEPYDEVECVIFLGQTFVRHGLGFKLLLHTIRRCSECGMTALYGVARPENLAALALLRRVFGKPVKTQVHFGYIATVFEIPLNRG